MEEKFKNLIKSHASRYILLQILFLILSVSSNVSAQVSLYKDKTETTPSVLISAMPGTSICLGKLVTFRATSYNADPNAVYIWKVGNQVVGMGEFYASSNLKNNDKVACIISSNADSKEIAKSNILFITVNETNTWTGLISTEWNNPDNWCGGIPDSSQDIIIDSAGVDYMPAILPTTMASCKNLYLGKGATLTLSGENILVSGVATINGTLILNKEISCKGITGLSSLNKNKIDIMKL